MNRLFKLQFVGPLAVLLATLCAELAAEALAYWPNSGLLWFVNLKIFGIFQRSAVLLSYLIPYDGFQLYGLAFPIFLLGSIGLLIKSRPAFTLATHLSVGFAFFLMTAWQVGIPGTTQASLVPIAVPSGPGRYVMCAILAACFVSFAITHLLYLSLVTREVRALLQWLRSKGFYPAFANRDHPF